LRSSLLKLLLNSQRPKQISYLDANYVSKFSSLGYSMSPEMLNSWRWGKLYGT